VQRLFAEHNEEHFDGVVALNMSKLVVSKLQAYAQFSFQLIVGESIN
jgi:hypothetical protein